MHPNLYVCAADKLVQPTGVVEVQVADDDLLDVLDAVARGLDGGTELVLGLVSDTGKDVGQLGPPDGGVLLAAPRLPEDEPLVGVVDEDAVHGQLATLVGKGLALGALEAGVGAADDKGFIALEPADLEEVEGGARGACVVHVGWNSALVDLLLNSGRHDGLLVSRRSRYLAIQGRKAREGQNAEHRSGHVQTWAIYSHDLGSWDN